VHYCRSAARLGAATHRSLINTPYIEDGYTQHTPTRHTQPRLNSVLLVMSAASTSSSAPSSASAAANTPTQVEVYHQLLKLKIKQCGHRNRLTDEEVETRERLFKLMYAERDTGVYFYSMDTTGYPEALISTTLDDETFWPSLVTKTFIEEDH
jgi:hypothetical protein